MQPFYVRKRLEMELIAHLTKKSSIDFVADCLQRSKLVCYR